MRQFTIPRRMTIGMTILAALAAMFVLNPDEPGQAQGSAAGAYLLADTWPVPSPDRPADAWGQISGIELLPDGSLLVADADVSRPRIARLWPDGSATVLVEGQSGCIASRAAESDLCAPGHLAADLGRDRIYVADRQRGALLVYDLAGRWLRTEANLPGAQGLAVTPAGDVLVSSASSGLVHRFAPDGSAREPWQVVDALPGGGLLAGLDVDSTGQIYVLDGRSPQILVLNGAGKRAQTHDDFAGTAKLLDIAVANIGQSTSRHAFWIATNQGLLYSEERTEIGRLNPVGALSSISLGMGGALHAGYAGFNAGLSELFTFDVMTAVSATPSRRGVLPIPGGIFVGPEDFAIGRDGLARVLDRSERVQSLELNGRLDGQWAYGGALGVDAGPDGTIYAVDGKSIEILTAPPAALALNPIRRLDARADTGKPAFLTRVEVQGGTIFTLDIARRSLRRFDTQSGTEAPAIPLSNPALPSHWADLAVSSDGTAYVLDRLTGDLQIVASDATTRTLSLNRPARRVALRPDGEPIVLDEAGRLWHFDGAGALRGLVDVSRRDIALDSRPSDIDIDDQGRVFVIDRAANLVSRYDWDASAEPRQPDVERECVFTHDKIAQPGRINLGQSATIHLTASGECLRRRLPPLDVMLVIDASGSMAGDRIALTRQAAMDFTRALDLGASQVGVVAFSQTASLAIPLSSDEAGIWDALRAIRPFGASRIDHGLALAHQEWRANRRPGVGAVFILLSDGRSEVAPTLAAADAIKADGVEIFVVSTRGAPAERALMEAIASTPDHHFEANEPAFLLEVLDAIAQRIASVKLLLSATITDRLPANMAYIAGSAVPPPDEWNPITRVLRWELLDVPFSGFDIRFDVTPTEVGVWPTNVEASVDAINGFGRPESFNFPVPRVEVIAPTPTPTPTPTNTPTPEPKPVFLPIALRGCTPDQKHTDAMLVIDTSSSMTREKLEAAKAAARAFVDLLDLPRDQVGLVEFNATARLVSPLTGDASAIHRAIAALTPSPGTKIDAGLQMALTAMSGPGLRDGNTPTIILLTDGVQPDGQSEILNLGDAICQRKIELFTIGLGSASDVDFGLLQMTACSPGMAFLAPGVADLKGIYATIAAKIPCDPPNWRERP